MDKTVLIDADAIVYSAGWAGCRRYYVYRGKEYQYKKELPPGYDEDDLHLVVEPEELRNTYSNVRKAMDSILEALAPVNTFKAYLTGKGNFREKIATIQPYKGNRSEGSKPPFYSEIRKYLVDTYAADVVEGMEADDRISIEFCKDVGNTVIAAVDKDYLQIPLLRMYNIQKKEVITVTPIEAHRNFYTQVLMGDTTDNIPGLQGVGKKTAEKLLANQVCPIKMEQLCYNEYRKAHAGKAWDYFVENATLLYLLRKEEDRWEPKIKP